MKFYISGLQSADIGPGPYRCNVGVNNS